MEPILTPSPHLLHQFLLRPGDQPPSAGTSHPARSSERFPRKALSLPFHGPGSALLQSGRWWTSLNLLPAECLSPLAWIVTTACPCPCPPATCSQLSPQRDPAKKLQPVLSHLHLTPSRGLQHRGQAKVPSGPVRLSTKHLPLPISLSILERDMLTVPDCFCFYWSRMLYKIRTHVSTHIHPPQTPALGWPPPALLSPGLTQGHLPTAPPGYQWRSREKEPPFWLPCPEAGACPPPVGEQVGVTGKGSVLFSPSNSLSRRFRSPSTTAAKALGSSSSGSLPFPILQPGKRRSREEG